MHAYGIPGIRITEGAVCEYVPTMDGPGGSYITILIAIFQNVPHISRQVPLRKLFTNRTAILDTDRHQQ